MGEIDKLKVQVEAARSEVNQCEKEISNIQIALRRLGLAAANAAAKAKAEKAEAVAAKAAEEKGTSAVESEAESPESEATTGSQTEATAGGETSDSKEEEVKEEEEEDVNTLKIYATKVTGLPEAATPKIDIQLSSPIESQTITELFDPLDTSKAGSIITFKGVESSVATIVVEVSDGDNIPLGSSAVHDVEPLCSIDVLNGVVQKVTELDFAIVPPNADGDDNGYGKADADANDNDDTTNEEEAKEVVSTEKKEEEDDTEDDFQDAKSTVTDGDDVANADDVAPSDNNETEPPSTQENGDETKPIEETQKDEETVEKTKDEDETPEQDDTVTNADGEKKQDGSTETETDDAKADTAEAEAETETKEEASDGEKDQDGSTETDDVKADTAEAKTETKEEANESESKTESEATSTATLTLIPTCVISFRIEYNASTKEQKDHLYDLLHKASKKKVLAREKWRTYATALNRAATAAALSSSGGSAGAGTIVKSSGDRDPTVKAGFLNKKKKQPMFLVRWYQKTLGPNSLTRKVYPIAKNYVLFFGGVVLMHFYGQELALPPPV